jgi:putative membrane protein
VEIVAVVLTALVAVIHAYFLVLEMFLWKTPRGRAIFGTSEDFADETATLAANQGLYNGFLSAGLVWALIVRGDTGHAVAIFFLLCVIVAGLYGGATVSRRILAVQATPAVLALAAVIAAG